MFSHVWSRVGSCCSHMYLNQILANYHGSPQWKGQLALAATWLGLLQVEIPNTGCHPATLAIISSDQVQHNRNVGSIQLPQLCPWHVMSLRVLSHLKRLWPRLFGHMWTEQSHSEAEQNNRAEIVYNRWSRSDSIRLFWPKQPTGARQLLPKYCLSVLTVYRVVLIRFFVRNEIIKCK